MDRKVGDKVYLARRSRFSSHCSAAAIGQITAVRETGTFYVTTTGGAKITLTSRGEERGKADYYWQISNHAQYAQVCADIASRRTRNECRKAIEGMAALDLTADNRAALLKQLEVVKAAIEALK